MRTFAAAYPDSIAQQAAAQLPWRHIMILLDKVADPDARAWYAEQDVRHGWSSAVLAHHVSTDRYARIGSPPSTFPQTLTPAETDQARELLQDPYVLDFLALDPHHSERDLEDAIVARLTRFLTELGTGFAFVGRQYRLAVGRSEYFPDRMRFQRRLRRLIRDFQTGRKRLDVASWRIYDAEVSMASMKVRSHSAACSTPGTTSSPRVLAAAA